MRINYRTQTFFRNFHEASAFRLKAFEYYNMSSLPPPSHTCLYKRSNGRNPKNLDEVESYLRAFPEFRLLSFDFKTPVQNQLLGFSTCKLLVSPHGSHNVNIMFMQPGSGFLEMNPFKFFHHTWQELAETSGLIYLPSRNNEPFDQNFKKLWPNLRDYECQAIKACRIATRSSLFLTNMTDLKKRIGGFLHAVEASSN
jgi:hypothetical protein